MSDKSKEIIKLHVCHQFVEQYQIDRHDNFTIEGVAKVKCGTPQIEVEAGTALRWARAMETYEAVQKEIKAYADALYTPVVPTVLGHRTWEQSNLPPEAINRELLEWQNEPPVRDPDSRLTRLEGELPHTPTPETAQRALLAAEVPPLEGGLKKTAFRTVIPAGG